MGQLTIFQQEGLLELDGRLLHVGDRIEFLLIGSWVPGTISHDERGWYLATREGIGIRLQTGLPARLLSLSLNALPSPVRLQNSFADIDEVFSRLDQLRPPTDFLTRIMLVVSRLPLPQMREVDAELPWDYEDLIVHHEDKRPHNPNRDEVRNSDEDSIG